MAALTMSFDREACRYAAAVQTNGHRVEMITPSNLKSMMVPLFKQWIAKVGGNKGPDHIYYFRDGVSEGQFSQVLEQEVDMMKKILVDTFGPPAGNVSCIRISRQIFTDNYRSNGLLLCAPNAITFASSPRRMMDKLEIRTVIHSQVPWLSMMLHIRSSMTSTYLPIRQFRVLLDQCITRSFATKPNATQMSSRR